MPGERLNQIWSQRQAEDLRKLRDLTGISVSELLRRFTDHCMQEQQLNQIVPTMSGSLASNLRGI